MSPATGRRLNTWKFGVKSLHKWEEDEGDDCGFQMGRHKVRGSVVEV